MTALDYQILVYKSSVTSTQIADVSTGSVVDFTLGVDELSEPPITVTPTVDPLSGRVESRLWTARVADISTAMTARLADSSGHAQLLQRYTITRRDTTGGWVNIGAGRIANIDLDSNVAEYILEFVDEMGFARNTVIFTTNTTRIWPPGLAKRWGGYEVNNVDPFFSQGLETPLSADIIYDSGVLWRAEWAKSDSRFPLQDRGRELIINDLKIPNGRLLGKTTQGSFQNLQIRVEGSDSTDYTITSFGLGANAGDLAKPFVPLEDPIKILEEGLDGRDSNITCWFLASSGILPGNASSGTFDSYIHMMSLPPTDDLPLHLGGFDGIHPAQLLLDVYEGTHSTAGALLPSISTAAWSGATGLLTLNRIPMATRVTEQANLGEWTEDNIYGAHSFFPFVDGRGLIAPKDETLPANPEDWSSTSIFQFDGSNLVEPHPTFHHPREQFYSAILTHGVLWQNIFTNQYRQQSSTFPNDLIVAVDGDFVFESSVSIGRGRFVYDMPYSVGFTLANWQTNSILGEWFGRWKRDFFDRYQDGAVQGAIHTLSGSSLEPGDFVNIDLETYPTMNTQTRGGAAGRTVQLLGKEISPDRYTFPYLDVGPALQSLDAPTVTLTTFGVGSIDPHHNLKVAIGAISSQGASYELHIANSATIPGASASAWRSPGLFITDGVTFNTTPRITQLPSGSTWWARARATKHGRVRSAWTNSTKKATQAMGAPSAINVATSQITAPEVVVTWSLSTSTAFGADRFRPLTVHWDGSTVAPISSTNPFIIQLPVGSVQYTITNASANSTYKVGVRHYDGTLPWLNTSSMGGVGPSDSTTFETSGATLTATTIKSLSLTWGSG